MFPKVVHGPCFLCERLKRRMRGREDGTTRSNIFPRHRLSSFLLATRVKENFKFWLRWQSDRSWSQGKGNPPPFSLVWLFVQLRQFQLRGLVAGSLFFRDLPRDGAPWRNILHRSWPGCTAPVKLRCCLCSSLSKYLTFSEARVTSARSQLLLFSKLITKLLSSTIYTTRPMKWSIGSS